MNNWDNKRVYNRIQAGRIFFSRYKTEAVDVDICSK
jgi:hypothetical protein